MHRAKTSDFESETSCMRWQKKKKKANLVILMVLVLVRYDKVLFTANLLMDLALFLERRLP